MVVIKVMTVMAVMTVMTVMTVITVMTVMTVMTAMTVTLMTASLLMLTRVDEVCDPWGSGPFAQQLELHLSVNTVNTRNVENKKPWNRYVSTFTQSLLGVVRLQKIKIKRLKKQKRMGFKVQVPRQRD